MVYIERHGSLNLLDKPCLNSPHNSDLIQSNTIHGSSPAGHECQSKPFNTSDQIARNNISNFPTERATFDNLCTSPSLDTSCKYSKSTASLSLGVHLDSSFYGAHLQSPDTLPYFELPVVSRENYSYLAASSNLWQQSHFHSKRRSFGSTNLKFTFLCFFLSLLLLCRSCMCIISSDFPNLTKNTTLRQTYLTFVNETNLQGLTGQCLRMTGSFADDMCQHKDPYQREHTLNNTRTSFCGLPLTTLLSEEDKNVVLSARENCSHVLSALQDLDQELSEMFCQFGDVLERIDCSDTFATMGNCTTCKVSQLLSSVLRLARFNLWCNKRSCSFTKIYTTNLNGTELYPRLERAISFDEDDSWRRITARYAPGWKRAITLLNERT